MKPSLRPYISSKKHYDMLICKGKTHNYNTTGHSSSSSSLNPFSAVCKDSTTETRPYAKVITSTHIQKEPPAKTYTAPTLWTHGQIGLTKNTTPTATASENKKPHVRLSVSSATDAKSLIHVLSQRAYIKTSHESKLPLSSQGESLWDKFALHKTPHEITRTKDESGSLPDVLEKLKKKINSCKQRESLLITENKKLIAEIKQLRGKASKNTANTNNIKVI